MGQVSNPPSPLNIFNIEVGNSSKVTPSPSLTNGFPLPILPSTIYSFKVTKLFPLSGAKEAPSSPKPNIGLQTPKAPEENDEDEIYSIKKYKAIAPSNSTATGVDFSGNGQFLAATSQDNYLTIFDCVEGKVAEARSFGKMGLGPVRFALDSSHILIASDPGLAAQYHEDNLLGYYSVKDESFVQNYFGHSKPVHDICVAPQEDYFYTASLDNSIMLWDFRKSSFVANIYTPGRACIGFDPTGRVLAVADPEEAGITLFDIRKFTEGGFLHFNPDVGSNRSWTSVQFTNSGLHIALATAGSHHYVFDAFKGTPTHLPLKRSCESSSPLPRGELTITPNGRFIISGGTKGILDVWDLHSPDGLLLKPGFDQEGTTCYSRSPSPDRFTKVSNSMIQEFKLPRSFSTSHQLTGHINALINVVGFNPHYMTMVTGGSSYAFWEPNLYNLYLPQEADYTFVNAQFEDYC